MQEQLEDTDNDKEVSPDEPSRSGHIVKAYQCLQMMSKMNNKKQAQKQTNHYNLRSKGVPPTLREKQENIRLLIRKTDPPAAPKQKTQRKSRKRTEEKRTSVSRKLQNTPSDNTNTRFTLDIAVSLPPLD